MRLVFDETGKLTVTKDTRCIVCILEEMDPEENCQVYLWNECYCNTLQRGRYDNNKR